MYSLTASWSRTGVNRTLADPGDPGNPVQAYRLGSLSPAPGNFYGESVRRKTLRTAPVPENTELPSCGPAQQGLHPLEPGFVGSLGFQRERSMLGGRSALPDPPGKGKNIYQLPNTNCRKYCSSHEEKRQEADDT